MVFGELHFCLHEGQLFSEGSVNDSAVMLCSLALEQPDLENEMDAGLGWTQLPGRAGHI